MDKGPSVDTAAPSCYRHPQPVQFFEGLSGLTIREAGADAVTSAPKSPLWLPTECAVTHRTPPSHHKSHRPHSYRPARYQVADSIDSLIFDGLPLVAAAVSRFLKKLLRRPDHH